MLKEVLGCDHQAAFRGNSLQFVCHCGQHFFLISLIRGKLHNLLRLRGDLKKDKRHRRSNLNHQWRRLCRLP